jgi:hypothetical protein
MKLNEITEHLHRLEDLAVDVLAVLGPWLAPIPSAYLVGKATFNHLDWHEVIAGAAAVAVESIGVVSIILSLRLYEWNQTKNKTDPGAPLLLALFAAVFYFVVTIGLTVVLDVYPHLAKFAPAIFPLLAAIGAANIAMKNGQRRRESAKAAAKAERKEAKAAKDEPKPEPLPELSGNALLVFEALRAKGEATNVEIAESIGISPQRVGQIKKELNGVVKR